MVIRYNKYFIFLLFLGCLSVFHIPLITIKGDAIGVYDFFIIFFLFYTISKQNITNKELNNSLLYLIFLIYITINFLLLQIKEVNFFSIALYFKQIEYLLIFFVFFRLIKYSHLNGKSLIFILYIIVFSISSQGLYRVIILDEHRLGIPFKDGVSSNPAGFILGTTLLMLLFVFFDKRWNNKINKYLVIFVFLLGFISLFFTISRSNLIPFLFIMVIFLFIKFHRSFIYVFICLVLLLGFYSILAHYLDMHDPLRYFYDIDWVLNNGSFKKRYEVAWWSYYDNWSSSYFNIFFGLGIGSFKITDALIPNLIYSTGLIGFFIYFLFLGYIFFIGKIEMKLMVIFVLINSIGAETTLNTFRAMQVFLFSLAFLSIFYTKKEVFFIR